MFRFCFFFFPLRKCNAYHSSRAICPQREALLFEYRDMLLIDHEFTENCHDRRVVIIIIHVLKIICYILLNLIRMSQINFYEHRFIMNCRINWHLIWACLLLWLSHEHLIWLLPVLWRPVFRGIKMWWGWEFGRRESTHSSEFTAGTWCPYCGFLLSWCRLQTSDRGWLS